MTNDAYPISAVPPDAECRFAPLPGHKGLKGKDAFHRIKSEISSSVWWVCNECDSWHYPDQIIEKFGKDAMSRR